MLTKFKRMLPILIVMGVTIIVSLALYYNTNKREEKECWELLSDSAQSLSKDISSEFNEGVTVLKLMSSIFVNGKMYSPDVIQSRYLQRFSEDTVFSRIDVVFPDNTVLYANGKYEAFTEADYFNKLAKQGEHISPRTFDSQINSDAVYYYLPVVSDNKTELILVGVVDLHSLSEVFSPDIYGNNARICLIDTKDGSYLMDSWHKGELGNAYDSVERKRLKGYEDVDLQSDLRNLQSGVVAFESRTTGKPLYMHYMPCGVFDWELAIFAEEQVVFADAFYLRKLLIYAGITEAALLIVYFIWNLLAIIRLEKSESEAKKQLNISNTLIECVTELSSDKDTDKSLNNVLTIISHYFDADRTYIAKLDKRNNYFTVEYEYRKENVKPFADTLKSIPQNIVFSFFPKKKGASGCYFSDNDMCLTDEKKEIMEKLDVERFLAIPLIYNGIINAFIGIDNARQFYSDTTLLSSIQYFITNSLDKQQRQNELRQLSYRDTLTSMYNRNRYIHKIDISKYLALRDVGIAYIDLNGLKQINDQQGHTAGDNFIISSANVIMGIFPKNSYRIGGDEFVIIDIGVSQTDFEHKIQTLRDNMAAENISVSLGMIWLDKCDDLELSLKQADALMYDEKKKYHMLHDRRKSRTTTTE